MTNLESGFLIIEDWIPAIESLSGDDVKELILALINMQFYGKPLPEFTNKQTEIYARMIEPTIERRARKRMLDEKIALTVEELAAALSISRSYAYKLIREPGFPVVYIGRRALIPRRALEKWLEDKARG